MTVLITGVAGFIGFHTALALLERGDRVLGIDNLNDYYDVSLKEARRDVLGKRDGFTFERLDLAETGVLESLAERHGHITRIVHMAAQPGVRYSLVDPHAYLKTNVEGHLAVLEACRKLDKLEHLVYASSSSVYGANTDLPYCVEDRTDTPLSMYAATKKSMEMMSHAYSHLYRIPQTGLRFFTVYGPWGRPDMAPFIFISKILAGEPISVFNNGDMRRDFTYIDDIVAGVVSCLDAPPRDGGNEPPCRLYNIGNSASESLMDFIGEIEKALGQKAEKKFLPMQPGDVKETYANIETTRRDFGFEPKTSLKEGIPRLVDWYKGYYGV